MPRTLCFPLRNADIPLCHHDASGCSGFESGGARLAELELESELELAVGYKAGTGFACSSFLRDAANRRFFRSWSH